MSRSRTIRYAFAEAAHAFVEAVDLVGDDQWTLPALGHWDVRSLVAHAWRALVTVEGYLDLAADRVDIDDPGGYYEAVLDRDGVHLEVAERAAQQAGSLGPHPAATVRETMVRVLARLDDADDEQVISTLAGGIRLIDYLPTRVVELVVHTLDLTDALGVDPVLPMDATRLALSTLADVGARRCDPAGLLRALTGRADLPSAVNVLH